ncbi:MAG: hypothetical protein LBC12_00215, partial [Nitrososphaerota archaeon]|jgi:hypothetical protein|nr:hypothetical protein [Nitrososphaerota archaeon]
VFLFVYFSDLNLIGFVWSKVEVMIWKLWIKFEVELQVALIKAIECVASDDKGYFKHCGYANLKSHCYNLAFKQPKRQIMCQYANRTFRFTNKTLISIKV